MSCKPCEQKRQRLAFIKNARKQRAIEWGKENGLKEVVLFSFADEEGEDDCFSFAAIPPDGASDVEYISIL